MKPVIEECKKEFQVTEEQLNSQDPLPKDKKCFHLCVAQKVGFMDKDANLQMESFKKNMGAALAPEMMASVEKCATTLKKDEPCLMAEQMCRCVHEKP